MGVVEGSPARHAGPRKRSETGRLFISERAAVRTLTADIEAGLRGLTINAADWDTLRVLDAVRRLYQPPKIPLRDRVELARRFSLVYHHVRDVPGQSGM